MNKFPPQKTDFKEILMNEIKTNDVEAVKEEVVEVIDTPTEETDTKKKKKDPRRRRRIRGDRSDGRKIRTSSPMLKATPYIMARRSDALNTYADSFDVTEIDKFCRRKVKEGYTNFGFLHVFLAAYIRTVSQRPGINRFISGQKLYSRDGEIIVVMTIKRNMTLEANDTCIKARFSPTDTVDDVYRKFDEIVQANNSEGETNSFDKVNKLLLLIPGLLLRWTVKFLFFLDYFGWLPKKLLEVSPFHGSLIITSMGSLGIKPVYHHIYDFGNLPIFVAYGAKRSEITLDKDGSPIRKRYIDIKVVTDERICDGFYYASAFKLMRRFIEHPEVLETPPETVVPDID